MPSPDPAGITKFVEANIGEFHGKRLAKLGALKLGEVLKRKNPYLFRAKNLSTPETFVRAILDAYLSSQEETVFGEFLEKLAIHVCTRTHQGWKSGIPANPISTCMSSNRSAIRPKNATMILPRSTIRC